MIHGIEIKSTKSTGNKNSLSLSLSHHSTAHIHTTKLRYYRWDDIGGENSEVQLMCLSANMNLEPARRLQSTTHETLSLALWIFCNCLLLWFSYFSSRRLNNKKIYQQQTKKNHIRRRRRVDAVKGERDGREKVK